MAGLSCLRHIDSGKGIETFRKEGGPAMVDRKHHSQ